MSNGDIIHAGHSVLVCNPQDRRWHEGARVSVDRFFTLMTEERSASAHLLKPLCRDCKLALLGRVARSVEELQEGEKDHLFIYHGIRVHLERP